jgi:hypothetical protein
LLGHAYCRYAGGLLGEAALSRSYRKALGLATGSPKRLAFQLGLSPPERTLDPLPSLALLYEAFDEAGDAAGSPEARAAIVHEAAAAMRCNLHLHQEGSATFWERSSVGHALTLGVLSTRGLRRMTFGAAAPPAAAMPPAAAPGLISHISGQVSGLLAMAKPPQSPATAVAPPTPSTVGKMTHTNGGATMVGAAGELVSAEHSRPLTFVTTEGQRTEMLYERRMLTRRQQLQWKAKA